MHTLSVEECFNSDEEESSEVCVDDFFAPPSTEDAQGSVLSVQSEPAPFVAPTTAWPLLATRGAHKEDVQCMVFELWCAYNAFRASTALHQLGDKFRFGDVFIPIFDRPPGYKGVKSQMLKYEILQSHYGTLGMQRAVCVIDHASNNTEARQYGDRVSFAGPRARTLYDTPFHDGEKQLFVARMGGAMSHMTRPSRHGDTMSCNTKTTLPPSGIYVSFCLIAKHISPVSASALKRESTNATARMLCGLQTSRCRLSDWA